MWLLFAGAQVRSLDFARWFNGSGVLHTKLWIVDKKHFYVGSANMDWRSLTQVLVHVHVHVPGTSNSYMYLP